MILAVGLSCIAFIMLRLFPLCPLSGEFFFVCFLIINGCWILSKAFSVSVGKIIWFLQFVIVYHVYSFVDIEKPSRVSEINPTWSWCMILLYYWIWIASLLLRIFASVFISEVGLMFPIHFKIWILFSFLNWILNLLVELVVISLICPLMFYAETICCIFCKSFLFIDCLLKTRNIFLYLSLFQKSKEVIELGVVYNFEFI